MRIFKILIFFIIILAAGIGVYWFFDREQAGTTSGSDGGLSIGDLFPFGNNGNPTTNTPTPINTGTSTPTNPSIPTPTPRLWQISTDPQAGAITFIASGTPYVRFVDKATGNIFESGFSMTGLKRITNTTIPKVQEAEWQPGGNALVLRYLGEDNETIKSGYASIASSTTEQINSTSTESIPRELQVTFMQDNIDNLTVNYFSGAVAYVANSQSGGSVTVENRPPTNPREIFSMPIRDLRVSWINNSTIGLLLKPSNKTPGQFYFLKSDTGSTNRILGGIMGLSAIASPDLSKVAYSENTTDLFDFKLFNVKNGTTTDLPSTLAEKCVWSQKTSYLYCAIPRNTVNATYPDAWYQGKISFNDTVVRINTDTGATELVVDPFVETKRNLDATNLQLDPTETYLIFTNKKDSQLWGLKIQAAN